MKNDRIVLSACMALAMTWVTSASAVEPIKLSAQQVQKLGIQTSPAQLASEVTLSFPAQVMLPADRQWLISAPAAGLVQSLSVREGDAEHLQQALALHSPPSFLRRGVVMVMKRSASAFSSKLAITS